MATVNCIECGSNFYLDSLSYWDYEGQVKCPYCQTLFEIKVERGSIKFLRHAKKG